MTLDAWTKLRDLALGDDETGVAKIEIDPNDASYAALAWPDGTTSHLHLRENRWEFSESLSTSPCDVAARDSL